MNKGGENSSQHASRKQLMHMAKLCIKIYWKGNFWLYWNTHI